MDTSDQYLNMCQKAKEMQAVKQQGQQEFYRQIATKRYWVPIWLPRQDQLQAMLNQGVMTHVIDFHHFWFQNMYYDGFVFLEEDNQFESLEQLWLAYIMAKKYKKKWDGKNWFNVKEK